MDSSKFCAANTFHYRCYVGVIFDLNVFMFYFNCLANYISQWYKQIKGKSGLFFIHRWLILLIEIKGLDSINKRILSSMFYYNNGVLILFNINMIFCTGFEWQLLLHVVQ